MSYQAKRAFLNLQVTKLKEEVVSNLSKVRHVHMRFKNELQCYSFNAFGSLNLTMGDKVIVDTQFGPSLGTVAWVGPAEKLFARWVVEKYSVKTDLLNQQNNFVENNKKANAERAKLEADLSRIALDLPPIYVVEESVKDQGEINFNFTGDLQGLAKALKKVLKELGNEE